MRFKDISIRKKLTVLLMGVSTAAVVVACLTFYLLIIDRYQQSYLDDLRSLADITGSNCSASLVFGIPEDAKQLLVSLNKRPSITAATIHDNSGNLFVSYTNGLSSENTEAGNPAVPSGNIRPGDLLISQDIEINGKKIGIITLYDDMRNIRTFKYIALMIVVVIVIVVMGLTALFSTRLKEVISKPISNLADIAQEISTRQDYSLRAAKESADEIGSLVDAFNTMLSQIAQRTEDLQKSERRFRTLVDQAVDAFFLHDMEGRILDVNQRACDSLGYSREALLAMTMLDVDEEAEQKQYKKKYWTRMLPGIPATIEGRHRRKDGEAYPVEVRSGLLELGGEKMIIALARDITERLAAEKERLALESQLQQAQKIEAIGTLAGGIAHDFNNILTPILGYLELARMKVSEGSELSDDLKEVRKAADRAREMVKQILTFSKRDAENMFSLEVHVIIKEVLKLLRASIPTTIEIRQNIDSHCGPVLANPTQIHQVLMNLCTNAYHAMRETGGVLGVSLVPLEIHSRDFIKNINLKPGPYLRLEVSDTGHGMDRVTRERIFEPYFTTKAEGKGTGMGLAVVHGVVKGIGGHITVYSELGKGTTFHIYLPVIGSSILQTEDLFKEPIPTGTEKILLVDDEETVRGVEKLILTGLGYEVRVFACPLDALDHFTAQPDIFDLVITDMTMPKMTGDKLAREIMAIRTDIPVILCTGFSDLVDEESAKAMGIRAYVVKPIIRQTFARTVRNVLDGVENTDLT